MKKLILLFLLFTAFTAMGQTTVTILPENLNSCLGGRASFDVFINPDTTEYVYKWSRNGSPILSDDSLQPRLELDSLSYADSGYYTVDVFAGSINVGSDTAWLHFLPVLVIDTLYRYNDLGCPGSCKGQMFVNVSGGNPPYDYLWGGGISQDTIVTSLCKGDYLLTVYDSDSTHCISRNYTIEVLVLPKISFLTDPPDTVFLTNPVITAAFPDTSMQRLDSWEWIFKQGIGNGVSINNADSAVYNSVNPVTHTYSKEGLSVIKLHFTDINGCDSTVMDSIRVMIAKLKIPNVFTPNGDTWNNNFVIQVENASEKTIADVYKENELVVLNRWGKIVYKKQNYISTNETGEWDGGNLAEGVYFYIFTGHGYYGDDVWKGSVTITGRKYKPE